MQQGRFRATGMMIHHPYALRRSSVATSITEQVGHFWKADPGQSPKAPKYLVSRWGALAVAAVLTAVYAYFAFFFSFCYHTIAYLGGVAYPWPDALVTSAFMPFFIGDLPKHSIAVRLLGGVHGTLVVAIGVGAIVNFFRRKMNDIRKSAEDMSNLLANQDVREKYLILEQRVKNPD
jgi:hypothetical protein